MLGRNVQLARGPSPPFYEKLVDQIQQYIAKIHIGPPVNPFAQTMRIANVGSDDDTRHTYDAADVEMEDGGHDFHPLPDYTDLDIDNYIDFVQQFTKDFMKSTKCTTAILIYLQVGTYAIATLQDFKLIVADASINTQQHIVTAVQGFGAPFRSYGIPEQEEMPEHVSTPDVSVESLPFDEQIDRN